VSDACPVPKKGHTITVATQPIHASAVPVTEVL
jgi:hypothetical protein